MKSLLEALDFEGVRFVRCEARYRDGRPAQHSGFATLSEFSMLSTKRTPFSRSSIGRPIVRFTT
ncbi:hypothetical protein [Bradyrhizobium sp. CCBAU 25338]|uniref:hypothetical protein n=1 Tax=Bradyrhizobium sp. CCBAU 25338 TaxID=1641877 RepID=UPI003FA4BA3E